MGIDQPPTPAIMNRHLSVKVEDTKDYDSEHARRARAFQWHSRWAMPPYDIMIKQVRKTSGLDITEADVDLLPWGPNKFLDRRAYEKMQSDENYAADRANAQEIQKEREEAEREAARLRQEREEARRRREEEVAAKRAAAERLRREQEAEAKRKRLEEEREQQRQLELERKRLEELDRKRREEEERLRREKEDRLRREEEERQRREIEARLRQEKEERLRREEEERRRREEEERRRREEEDRRRREEEERRRRESEAARLAEEARRRQEEQERRRREEELRRQQEAARRLPPPITKGDTPVERAYRCFETLAKPTRATMLAAIEKTDGLDMDEEDIEALPWTNGDKELDYPRLHDLLEKEKKRSLMSKSRKKKLVDLWKSMGRPNKEQFRQLLLNVSDFNDDDISVLTWDPNEDYIIENGDEDRKEAALRRQKERMRKKIEEDERERQQYELDIIKRQRHMRPPPPPVGDSPLERVYRWYFRLNGVKRDYMINVANKEAVDFTADDVHLLPWIKEGAILDFGRLKELLDEIESKRKKEQKKNKHKDEEDEETEERRERAFHWYKALAKPKRETMYRLIDETDGMDIKKSDVDLLKWDTARHYVLGKE